MQNSFLAARCVHDEDTSQAPFAIQKRVLHFAQVQMYFFTCKEQLKFELQIIYIAAGRS